MYTLHPFCQRVDVAQCGWHSSRMDAHTTWLVANWKMNGNAALVCDWAAAVNTALMPLDPTLKVTFCPPAIYLEDARRVLPNAALLGLGAQNCHHEARGAYTGEISAAMLVDKGCHTVIVGHSECRNRGDCDTAVVKKAKAAIDAGLMPLICVGESLADYEQQQTLAALDAQLAQIAALDNTRYAIAYEPLWAIGSGRTPTLAEISAAHSHIKSVLGSRVNVLYGGSVNAGNIHEILTLPDVSGALIGGASLEIHSMCALMERAAQAVKGK